MNDAENPELKSEHVAEKEPKGLSLALAYSLLAAAIFAAMCIALFIVLPFYHRH
ncbi:MAG: hypothetical protein WBQ95_21920 [Terracidiphilus sp.]